MDAASIKIYHKICTSPSMVYMPAGMLIAERVLNAQPVVGVRLGFFNVTRKTVVALDKIFKAVAFGGRLDSLADLPAALQPLQPVITNAKTGLDDAGIVE